MITVDLEKRDYSRHNRTGRTAYLVRGLGKRAIRVILDFPTFRRHGNEELLAVVAAKQAIKRGWKHIVIQDDSMYHDGDFTFAFNKAQVRGRKGGWGPEVMGIWLGLSMEDTWDFTYLDNGDLMCLRSEPSPSGYDWDRYSDFSDYEDLGYLDLMGEE